jgi:hypothetical protein
MNKAQIKGLVLNLTIQSAFEAVDRGRKSSDEFLHWVARHHDPLKHGFTGPGILKFAAAAFDCATALKNDPTNDWCEICDALSDGNLDHQQAQAIQWEIIIEGLSLAIIDGVKVRFDQDQNGFHDAFICPSISHDHVLLDHWIVRGVVSKQDAFDQARAAVGARFLGWTFFHADPEGHTGVFPVPVDQLLAGVSAHQQDPSTCSNRFSKIDDQDQAKVLGLIQKVEAQLPWNDAIEFKGLTEPELRAMIKPLR